MICPQCGSTVPDGTPFCASCGRALAGGAAASFASSATVSSAAPTPSPTSGKAIASLILGILPLSVFSSIPAVVLGHLALSEIKKSAGRLQGRGMAIAGLVLGYLGIALVPFVLIIAAIAIPNLLRARIAANEASAVSLVRTINTAQISYQTMYPDVGYAPDLQSLGSGSPTCGVPSRTSACLIEYRLSSATNSPGKSGYIFQMQSTNNGKSYFVSAMPAVPNQSGVRSFCSTEEGVVRVDLSGGQIADAAGCAALPMLE